MKTAVAMALLLAAGVVGGAAYITGGGPHVEEPPAGLTGRADPVPAADAGAETAAALAEPASEHRDVRDVTPPGVTPPPRVSGPLQRLAARETPAKPLGPAKPRLLRPIVVEDGTTLKAGEITVKLPGLEVPGEDEQCKDAAGKAWPCGRHALAALRAYVRGRGVLCTVPEDARDGTFTSACKLGTADVGEWMVRRGWARPSGDDPKLAAAAEAAAKEKAGLHRQRAPAGE